MTSWIFKLAVILGIATAGTAEALTLGKWVWLMGLGVSAVAELLEIVSTIVRSSPAVRVKEVLAGMSEWLLRDTGHFTITVFQQGTDPQVFVPVFRYARSSGLLVSERYRRFGATLKSDLQFHISDSATTLSAAICDIGGFYLVEDIPKFDHREAMIRYHVDKRGLQENTVRRFSDRAVGIRSVGSVAIVQSGGDRDVIGVLTIDSTSVGAFSRVATLHGKRMSDTLAFWADRLACAIG